MVVEVVVVVVVVVVVFDKKGFFCYKHINVYPLVLMIY